MTLATGRVREICRYPIKGFAGEMLDMCRITAGKGIAHDRRWGVIATSDRAEAETEMFPPCTMFHALKKTPAVAAVKAQVSEDRISLLYQGNIVFSEKISSPALCTDMAFLVSKVLELDDIAVIDHGHSPLWDYEGALLSIINMETVRELSGKIEVDLDPARFRGNVIVEGLSPWSEMDWIGRKIQIGSDLTVLVVREIPRCRATCINPATAEEDHPVPQLLRKHYGHANLGVLGVPVTDGAVSAGDLLQ